MHTGFLLAVLVAVSNHLRAEQSVADRAIDGQPQQPQGPAVATRTYSVPDVLRSAWCTR